MAVAANTRSLVCASFPLRTTERYLRWHATLPMTWRRGPKPRLMGLLAPTSWMRAGLVTFGLCIRDRGSLTGGVPDTAGRSIRGRLASI
jgi:hypothetical protein